MNIKGTLYAIGVTQQITEKFRKREFVIEEKSNPSYPELIKFEAQNDKVDLLDKFMEGEEIDVHFNIRGKEWRKTELDEPKYFVTLVAWKIDNVSGGVHTPEYAKPDNINTIPQEDDLPF